MHLRSSGLAAFTELAARPVTDPSHQTLPIGPFHQHPCIPPLPLLVSSILHANISGSTFPSHQTLLIGPEQTPLSTPPLLANTRQTLVIQKWIRHLIRNQVLPRMACETPLLFERIRTLIALEGFIPGVLPHLFLQMTWTSKGRKYVLLSSSVKCFKN